MLKIRLQGTIKDIRWFKMILEKHSVFEFYRYQIYFQIKEQIVILEYMQKWKR